MKSTLIALFAAVALTLSLAAAAVQATESPAASSVAGMLQKKHDAQVRAQLVTESRWEEIRQLDAVTAQRAGTQRAAVYDRANKQLAHATGADAPPIDARALECESDLKPIR